MLSALTPQAEDLYMCMIHVVMCGYICSLQPPSFCVCQAFNLALLEKLAKSDPMLQLPDLSEVNKLRSEDVLQRSISYKWIESVVMSTQVFHGVPTGRVQQAGC